MKITRILPKPFAIAFEEYEVAKLEGLYEYHKQMVVGYENWLAEAKEELRWLKGE